MPKTALLYSDAYTRFDYGPEHPLRMERLGLTWRLMEAYGLTTLPGMLVREPEPADEARIAEFHSRAYLEVLKASDGGLPPARAGLFGLGPGDNPVFAGLWQVARLAAGGSLDAADLVAGGDVDRAFHFAGGLHHAMPARASGFCYVNDAVLA
ncbi:MAG: acetoin utilization protein AcuC, partial [Candidatus Rokuibacteriota bacterium]